MTQKNLGVCKIVLVYTKGAFLGVINQKLNYYFIEVNIKYIKPFRKEKLVRKMILSPKFA
jgi:hypothetical protein